MPPPLQNMLSKIFLDFEKIIGKEYTVYFTAGTKDFKLTWRERTILEMMEIIKDFNCEGDLNKLENQVKTELALAKFLKSVDSNITIDQVRLIPAEQANEIIDKIFDPIFQRKTGTAKKKKQSRKTAGIKILRQIMFLMRYANGAISHQDAVNMTFTQLFAYIDALIYWMQNETKKGQKANDTIERMEDLQNLGIDGIDEIKAKAKAFKNKINTDGGQKSN